MNGRLLLSIVLAFSLVLAGCGVGPGLSGNADHAFIVSGDAFRLAERSLLGEGVVVNVVEPLSFDADAGLAAFTTSEAGVFVHAMVRDGVEAAVVVMAFDDEGGWVFTDFVSGERAVGDVDALERLAASDGLSTLVASSDVALAHSLLAVFGFTDGTELGDSVSKLCAACSSQRTARDVAVIGLATAWAGYSLALGSLASCAAPVLCPWPLAALAVATAGLAAAQTSWGLAQQDLDRCISRSC